jgi:hypothetical protein
MKILFSVLFRPGFLIFSADLYAQLTVKGYLNIGQNNISEGFNSQLFNICLFEKTKWGVQGGYELGLVQPQDVIFNSWYLSSYGKLKIGCTPLLLGSKYLWTAFSPDLRETNWIIFARATLTHWQFDLGTSTSSYRLSNKAAELFGSEQDN